MFSMRRFRLMFKMVVIHVLVVLRLLRKCSLIRKLQILPDEAVYGIATRKRSTALRSLLVKFRQMSPIIHAFAYPALFRLSLSPISHTVLTFFLYCTSRPSLLFDASTLLTNTPAHDVHLMTRGQARRQANEKPYPTTDPHIFMHYASFASSHKLLTNKSSLGVVKTRRHLRRESSYFCAL